MCALVDRAEQAKERVWSDPTGVVLLDRFGSRPGHLLIISRAHVEDTADLPYPDYEALQRLAYRGCQVLRHCLSPVRIFNAVLGASAQVPMSFPPLPHPPDPPSRDGRSGAPRQCILLEQRSACL